MTHTPLAGSPADYAAIVALILLVVGTAGVIMLLAHGLPKLKRRGPVKDSTYESGVETIGDARRRFNIRFYMVAMVFLLFDVELVFMYPWALLFHRSASGDAVLQSLGVGGVSTAFYLGEMAIFFAILLVGYAYAWRKRVFMS